MRTFGAELIASTTRGVLHEPDCGALTKLSCGTVTGGPAGALCARMARRRRAAWPRRMVRHDGGRFSSLHAVYRPVVRPRPCYVLARPPVCCARVRAEVQRDDSYLHLQFFLV